MNHDRSGFKRYNLVLHEDLFNQINDVSVAEGTTVVEIIRKFLKVGLYLRQLEKQGDNCLIIRNGTKEQQLKIL